MRHPSPPAVITFRSHALPKLKIRAVSVCVASWGLVASLQSIAYSFSSLLVLRAALGIGEAAFVGVPFYMSFFYKRDELAFRTGLFISAAPLAISFASTLAWVITKVGTKIPISAWRLLFLIEGFPSIVVAVFVWLYIPDDPESAKYLTRREQKVAKLRLRKEKDVHGKGINPKGLKWQEILDTLIDPKSYLTAVSLHSCRFFSHSPDLITSAGNVLLRKCSLLLSTRLPPHHHQRNGPQRPNLTGALSATLSCCVRSRHPHSIPLRPLPQP